MRFKAFIVLSAIAGTAAFAAPAAAAPINAAPARVATTADGGVENVHWRRYRHCHWRNGVRRCHGARHWRRYGHYGYYDRPRFGFYLNLGDRNRHHRRWHRY